MSFGVQACMPLRNAGLHPDNTRLGNGAARLQRTLPEIRGTNLDGPDEVKVKTWPECKAEGFPFQNATERSQYGWSSVCTERNLGLYTAKWKECSANFAQIAKETVPIWANVKRLTPLTALNAVACNRWNPLHSGAFSDVNGVLRNGYGGSGGFQAIHLQRRDGSSRSKSANSWKTQACSANMCDWRRTKTERIGRLY